MCDLSYVVLQLPTPTSVQQLQSHLSCSPPSVQELPCPPAGTATAHPSSLTLVAIHIQGEVTTAGFFTERLKGWRKSKGKKNRGCTFFKLKINDLALGQVARCGWCSPALLGMLEKEMLTAGSATCSLLQSALILCSCKNTVKSIPRSRFQSPNCC